MAGASGYSGMVRDVWPRDFGHGGCPVKLGPSAFTWSVDAVLGKLARISRKYPRLEGPVIIRQ